MNLDLPEDASVPDAIFRPSADLAKPSPRELAEKLLDPFTQAMREVDETDPKFKLSRLWEECLKIHDENAMLRGNMAQQQFFLQDMAREWVRLRKAIGDASENLDVNDDEYLKRLVELQKLNSDMVNNIGNVTKTVMAIRKEIRSSEYQDKLRLPVEIVNMMIAGLTGILMVELQNDPQRKYRILQQMQKLSAAMGMLHQQALDADEEPLGLVNA